MPAIGGFVRPSTSLKQFLEQYDNASKSRAKKEVKSEFDYLNSNVQLNEDR
jgi:hypothetical protein